MFTALCFLTFVGNYLFVPFIFTMASPIPTHRTKVVYLVRHAEAEHNIKEREAVQEAIARGVSDKGEQEKARKAVLKDEKLTDARLSPDGTKQVRRATINLNILHKAGFSKYPAPSIVLVSPLRRGKRILTCRPSFDVPYRDS